MNFFPNVFSILGRCQLYIIAKHKASNCFKTEAVIQRFSGKKEFLKNLEKFTGKPLCQSLFFDKVVGLTNTFIEHLWWLPLVKLDPSL